MMGSRSDPFKRSLPKPIRLCGYPLSLFSLTKLIDPFRVNRKQVREVQKTLKLGVHASRHSSIAAFLHMNLSVSVSPQKCISRSYSPNNLNIQHSTLFDLLDFAHTVYDYTENNRKMSTKPIFVATHPRACSTAFERVCLYESSRQIARQVAHLFRFL